MTWQRWSVYPVWALVIAAAIVVGVASGRDQYLTWLPIVFAAAILLTFAIQLATGRTEGYVTRATTTIAGATGILMVATGVLWLLS